MESIRYASKQVNKPPTRTHRTFLSPRAVLQPEPYHVLAPFFSFPSFPRSLSFLFFFFFFLFIFHLYRSTSYGTRMTNEEQTFDVLADVSCTSNRLTILSLVERRGSLRNRLDDCIVRNESDKLWNINVGYRNCVGYIYIYISGELNLKERLFFTVFARPRYGIN